MGVRICFSAVALMACCHFAGATEPIDSTWQVEPLSGLNTDADEVLIGWDDSEIYFGRVETSWNGGEDGRWFLANRQDFTARRNQGWSRFESPIHTQLMANRFPSWDALGEIQHVAIDPKRGILVMSVWMEDGQFDLHMAQQESGEWSIPKPMEGLNTSADEVFPNFNGSDLWFGSNRSGGLGGFDIYRATRVDLFSKAVALPRPINSAGDDLTAVSAGSETDSGVYISSARSGDKVGVDLFWMGPTRSEELQNAVRLAFEIRHQREPLKNLDIYIRQRGGRHLFSGELNDKGRIEIGTLSLDAAVEVRVESKKRKGSSIPDGAVCHVYESCPLETCLLSPWPGWKHIRSYRLTAGEVFIFDLLPLDVLGDLERPSEIDWSELKSRIGSNWEARFGSNEFKLSENVQIEFVKWLRSFEWREGQWPENGILRIEGHADTKGTPLMNDQLSLQRAEFVSGIASKTGLDSHRMEVVGRGSALATGRDVEDRKVIVRWVQN